ncbi:uncharacterized protein L969DRAFT_79615 [Mixia osmundae IAM 14324]|uniref:Uncharacterized protein n=1 Tax=Mixia osmundae (strain CBS 9802 / IAM 14324 / JCM 22182 / KY 12970) TaxID=764103 RepID=G7E1J5_MIXOS|nr:uncharacterized protein L969DRAFT_79615 [Mixia osmundae IAM 14324]KEI36658.1 hypothetical protein L969DRAFT_79615 [Mixia osmundae IAM 14324]GAA96705.1 hypothetical protein E5Q_03376 [Mixia osmundae IAM 14324]
MAEMRGWVARVQSGDTLTLRGKPGPQGQPPKERVLHLAFLAAPRPGSRDRADEPYSFASREYLRQLTIGKEVLFSVVYTAPAQSGQLDFGSVRINTPNGMMRVEDLIVREGWARVKESRNMNAPAEGETLSDEAVRRGSLQNSQELARTEARGIWASTQTDANHDVQYQPPSDPKAFLQQHLNKPITAVVEQVLNGSTLRLRLLLSPDTHQFVAVTLAATRSPRAAAITNGNDSKSEELGDVARFFTESRLLHQDVTVSLLGLPPPPVTSNTPFVATVTHAQGNIAAFLLQGGLARIVDPHAGLLGPEEMGALRRAEADAKAAKKGIWHAYTARAPNSTSSVAFDATVTRVYTGDSIGIRRAGGSHEERVILSSIRQAKATDPKQAGYANEAKELMRKRLIGKTVSVTTDYTKPPDGEFEAKQCVTIRLPNGTNVAEQLLERGLAVVIRHRRDDTDRSPEFDQLMAAEAKGQADRKGVHSGKPSAMPRINDASESANKANGFLAGFKRAGRLPIMVDFVATGSRFKIMIPRQEVKLTLALAGIRTPRAPRANEKGEPYGSEAHEFMNQLAAQRDAEAEIDSTDKSGGFLGTLWLQKDINAAEVLVREGLAHVDHRSAERLPTYQQLVAAEKQAQEAQRNLWSEYDAQAEAQRSAAIKASAAPVDPSAARTEKITLVISDIDSRATPFTFSFQTLQANGRLPELESLMSTFSVAHQAATNGATAPVVPRVGDLVSARFSSDNAWYRAKVTKHNPQRKVVALLYIDYGNTEDNVSYSSLRPLEDRFRKLPAQARMGILSMIKLPSVSSDYSEDAFAALREYTEGQILTANVDWHDVHGRLALTLYSGKASDPSRSINASLLREGHATVDEMAQHKNAYPAALKAYRQASEEARRAHAGQFEHGDPSED